MALVVIAVPALVGFQGSDVLTRSQLRDRLVQLGYDVTDLEKGEGKEKYSFVVVRAGLSIPVGAEISPSGGFIWFTVHCKSNPPSPDQSLGLLKKNAEIQPSFFYVSKSGKLMMAVSIENRGVTNLLLRTRAEKIVDDVANTKSDWQ